MATNSSNFLAFPVTKEMVFLAAMIPEKNSNTIKGRFSLLCSYRNDQNRDNICFEKCRTHASMSMTTIELVFDEKCRDFMSFKMT